MFTIKVFTKEAEVVYSAKRYEIVDFKDKKGRELIISDSYSQEREEVSFELTPESIVLGYVIYNSENNFVDNY